MSDYNDLKSLANNYRESISDSKNPDMFSLGYQWADKPHRHVYDLCKKLEEAADALEALEAENAKLQEDIISEINKSTITKKRLDNLLKEIDDRTNELRTKNARAALGESDGNN